MGTSSITITALTATPSLRGNKLKATVLATGPAANLPNLTLKTVVFYSSLVNDFTTAVEIARGNPEALDAGLIEEQTYYYWAFAVDNSDYSGAVFPVSPTAGVACTAIGMSGLAFGLANGKLVATVFGNALTIAVKTAAGNDPSASDPVYVAFPNAAATIGNYQIRQIVAALSVVVSSGSTLGVISTNLPFRLWVLLFDDGGTLKLGVTLRSYADGGILPLNDGDVASSTAEGGSGGADGTLIYSTVAVTLKSYRILGYCEFNSGLATLGAWNVNPDPVRLAVAGDKPSGLVKEVSTPDQVNSGTTLIPWDATIPQIAEGTSLFGGSTINITPRSAANWFEIDCTVYLAHSAGALMVLALFRDGATDAIAAAVGSGAADQPTSVKLKARILAGTAAQRSFSLRFGSPTVGTVTVNGSGGAVKLGGVLHGHVRIAELWG